MNNSRARITSIFRQFKRTSSIVTGLMNFHSVWSVELSLIYAIFSTRHVGETLVRWRTESRDKLNLLRSWRAGVSGVGIYIIDRTTASWFRVGTSKGARRGYFIYEMAWELKTRRMEGSDEEWIFIEVFKFHLSFRLFRCVSVLLRFTLKFWTKDEWICLELEITIQEDVN